MPIWARPASVSWHVKFKYIMIKSTDPSFLCPQFSVSHTQCQNNILALCKSACCTSELPTAGVTNLVAKPAGEVVYLSWCPVQQLTLLDIKLSVRPIGTRWGYALFWKKFIVGKCSYFNCRWEDELDRTTVSWLLCIIVAVEQSAGNCDQHGNVNRAFPRLRLRPQITQSRVSRQLLNTDLGLILLLTLLEYWPEYSLMKFLSELLLNEVQYRVIQKSGPTYFLYYSKTINDNSIL